MRTQRMVLSVLALSLAVAAGAAPLHGPLPSATPESQGMSTARLERMHAGLQRFVDEGKHSGLVWLLARGGRVVDFGAYGRRDIEADQPMEKDTIVRIYSMSKILTTVAVMILYEEGRFELDDPIGNYLPELAHMKVLVGGTAEKPLLADARTPITIEHLLTHTSGFTYDGDSGVGKLNRDAKIWESASLEEFVHRLAAVPLAHEPGERFTYGVSIDVLGALVEKLSGWSLPAFVEERICGPLEMRDTGFGVPEAKRARLAKVYELGPDHRLRAETKITGEVVVTPKLASGGGGMYSTAGDYARFMQMLLNGGQLEGVHVLSRKTVELMMANHLAHPEKPSDGFGLGGAVRLELASGRRLGSVGEFGWNGMATTYARMDPKEKMVLILLAQHLPYNEHGIFERFSTLAYQAIID